MIPKKIHYCWFGGSTKPESVIKCIESWKKYCPDYELIEWTENDIDITDNKYTKQAYEMKAWGFVPDYLRLLIIYNHGGIYLDTDVQIIKSFDSLLSLNAFAGFEDKEYVNLGSGFGAEKEFPFLKMHMEQYKNLSFINEDSTLNRTPSPQYTTQLLKEHSLNECNGTIQNVYGVTIFPPEYFCPKDFETGFVRITKNTYSIHQFDGSWCTDEELEYKNKRWKEARKDYIRHLPNHIAMKLLGESNYQKLKRLLGR